MRFLAAFVGALVLVATPPASAHGHHRPEGGVGLANATVLIIRHAEDAEQGPGLSAAGELRARAYAHYFRPFVLGEEHLHVSTLVATADSQVSHRPRLTLEPLSHASGIPIQQSFKDRDVKDLAIWLGQGPPGRTILISWHHGKIPKLLTELGLDPSTVFHRDHWPSHVYDKVVVLRFDRNGTIIPDSCRLIREPTPLE